MVQEIIAFVWNGTGRWLNSDEVELIRKKKYIRLDTAGNRDLTRNIEHVVNNPNML